MRRPTPHIVTRLLLASLLALGPVGAARAQAQAVTPGPLADEAAAREHYEKGTAAYALGDFAEAAKQYEAAFRVKLDPALLYNAAQAHRRANNKPRAIELYQNLLRLFPNAPNRDVARQHLDELKKGSPAPVSPPPAGGAQTVATATTPPPGTLVPPPIPTFEPTAGAPAVALQADASDRAPRPLYRKPWFWGAVAGVVLVGVVTAVAVAAGDDPAAKPSWGHVGEP